MSKKQKLVVFSGAGLSAESGLATFRDSNGLWAQYDPMEVCNYENWIQNFELVHHFYNLRRQELAKVQPNAAHKYFAHLESILSNEVEIIHLTQNVDDLLERAGVKKNIIHLHGELTKIICPNCDQVSEIGYHEFKTQPCKKCDYAYLKPKIVFFGEPAPMYYTMYEVLESLDSKDCVIVIGTSGNVINISGILSMVKNRSGIGLTILNNLEKSDGIRESVFDSSIYASASEAIIQIDSLLQEFYGKEKFNET